MTAIQILLVVAALLWLARYLVHLRSGGATRVLAVLAAGAGILLVVFPDLSTRLAGLVGVTRGVDLMIYVTLVAFGFLWLHQAARIRELEARLVDLARKIALDGASLPTAPDQAAPSARPGATDQG
ncbi:MAG: DUF2304 domain-containing protein [Thermoanaerobaculia bacterium]|nr:MAG: DUF2304 domain-containing protein [Thermoanaerobaculia bacterium]